MAKAERGRFRVERTLHETTFREGAHREVEVHWEEEQPLWSPWVLAAAPALVAAAFTAELITPLPDGVVTAIMVIVVIAGVALSSPPKRTRTIDRRLSLSEETLAVRIDGKMKSIPRVRIAGVEVRGIDARYQTVVTLDDGSNVVLHEDRDAEDPAALKAILDDLL
ncbi:MAG: hypothetical protein AAGE52_06065 [Myxococcota bacterium]